MATPRPGVTPQHLGPGPRDQGPSYITRAGYQRLRDEHHRLVTVERPKATEAVTEAAAHGDRSENAEYIYGKKKLRELDRRIRFLEQRLGKVKVVDTLSQDRSRVCFGATVTIEDDEGDEKEWVLVGEDETDVKRRRISWKSPVGKALMGRKVGDAIAVDTPGGRRDFDLVEIRYEPID